MTTCLCYIGISITNLYFLAILFNVNVGDFFGVQVRRWVRVRIDGRKEPIGKNLNNKWRKQRPEKSGMYSILLKFCCNHLLLEGASAVW